MRRSLLIAAWFVLLFIFNLSVHNAPVGNHPIIEHSLEGVEYFFAPIEIIASIVAIAVILRLTKEKQSQESKNAPIIQDK
jgi:hypothetical protein